MRVGGIILCGGKSSRMGLAKATLPFGEETMLARIVRLLAEVVDPIAVVAAADQELPPLPQGVLIARDDQPAQGPLEGLRAGLALLVDQVDAVYATSCDVPQLQKSFVEQMVSELGTNQITVPVDGKFHHPLASVYRVEVLAKVEQLLAQDQRRPFFLFQHCDTRKVPIESLRTCDPELATLDNLNCPEDYLAACEKAGYSVPPEVLAQLATD